MKQPFEHMILIKFLHSSFCQKNEPCDIVHLTVEAYFVNLSRDTSSGSFLMRKRSVKLRKRLMNPIIKLTINLRTYS